MSEKKEGADATESATPDEPGAPKTASGIQPALPPASTRRGSGVMRAPRERTRRRRHSRIDTQLPVEVLFEGQEESVTGRCANLSLGGMFLLLSPVPDHGQSLRVWLTLPTGDRLMVTGTVRWSTRDGVGIQHELLGARDTYVLSEYLASLKAQPE